MTVRGGHLRRQNRSKTDVENDAETCAAREPHFHRPGLDFEAILAPKNGPKRGTNRRQKEIKAWHFFGGVSELGPGPSRGSRELIRRGPQYVFLDKGAFMYPINTPGGWATIVCWAYPWGPGAPNLGPPRGKKIGPRPPARAQFFFPWGPWAPNFIPRGPRG